MTRQEAKFQIYQDQRMKQAEYDMNNPNTLDEDEERDNSDDDDDDDDALLAKTRARLESLYNQDEVIDENGKTKDDNLELLDLPSDIANPKDVKIDENRPKVDTTLLDDWTQERIRKANAARGLTVNEDDEENILNEDGIIDAEITDDNSNQPASTAPAEAPKVSENKDASAELDEGTQERIRKTIASRQIVTTKEELSKKKDKPRIEDNKVFQKFKDGTLVPESEKRKNRGGSQEDLGPFPTREHFIGFWEVLTAPTGFPPDDDGGDGSKSENLVLRVDGTTAGGPILDPQTSQKAAGGTWKVILDDNNKTAQLRIRLVIPPKKDRILVMEGEATKRSMFSLKELPAMARSTFGIPSLEAKAKQAKEQTDTEIGGLAGEENIFCTGKVRTTRRRRIKRFHLPHTSSSPQLLFFLILFSRSGLKMQLLVKTK